MKRSAKSLAPRMTVRVAAIAIMLAMVAGVASGAPATAATDSSAVVFIVDASGSMVRDTPSGRSRMDVAKQAVNETLSSLPKGTETGILVFGTGTGNADSERQAGCSDVKTLAPLAPVDVSALAPVVDGIQASGFTPIGPALRQAAALLPLGQPGSIVLVSDGVDTCAPPSSCEVASEVHRANPNIAIHVVAFGVDEDEAAQQQMTCIGGVGGGTSTTASDPKQLAARLRAASDATATASRLSAQGLRGVSLGMTLSEVRARVDGARVGEARTVDGVEIVLVDCGWGTVELRSNRVYSIVAADESVSTAEGITPGDTLGAATAMYGQPVDGGTTTGDVSNVYQSQPGSPIGYRVFYSPQKNTITRIVVCRCVPASAIATDPSQWEFDFDSVGPLTLGMTRSEATAAVPGLDSAGVIAGDDGTAVVKALFHDDRLVSVRVGGYELDSESMAAWGARLPHARGIRLGDSGATALNAFPEASFYRSLAGGISSIVLANRDGHLLTFDVGSFPGARYVDGQSLEDGIRAGQVSAVTVEDARITRHPDAWEEGYLS